ncbi:MAG: TonB-dependent receptor family protein [Alphaproteobacteria bacterium]
MNRKNSCMSLRAMLALGVALGSIHGAMMQSAKAEDTKENKPDILTATIYGRVQPIAVGDSLSPKTINGNSGSLTAPSVNQAKKEKSRVAGAVDVVALEEFSDKYALNLGDMLANSPGVYAQKRWGEEVRLSIRGSGLGRSFHLRGVQLLQDGVPISLADDSGDFQELDASSARYLEVYRGGNALQYGASSLGGAINLVTPTGHTAQADNEVGLEIGSDGVERVHSAVARRFEKGDAFVSITAAHSDGWRDHSEADSARVNSNVGLVLNDSTETRFYITYNNLNQDLPSAVTLKQALETPRLVAAINKRNDYERDIRSLRLANKTTFKLEGSDKLDVGAYATFKELFHPIFQVIDQEYNNYGVYARYNGSGTLAGHRNDVVLGSNVRLGYTDARQFINAKGQKGVKTAESDQDASSYSLYGENQFFLTPELALVAGGQLLYANRDFQDKLKPINNAEKDFTSFSPKLGVLWDYAEGQQFFANISRSYEVPTYSELVQSPVVAFVPVSAQKAWTGEIGARGKTKDIAWDATIYRSQIKGEMLNYTVAPNIPASTFNAGDTIHQGAELGVEFDVGSNFVAAPHRLTFRNTYNYSDFSFDGDKQYKNNIIAGAPQHFYRGELRYDHGNGWQITPNVEWVPEGAWVDYANTLRAPSYAVWGVKTAYTLDNGLEFYVDARNLANKRYVSNFGTVTDARKASTAVFYPGDGRSLYAGVKVKF